MTMTADKLGDRLRGMLLENATKDDGQQSSRRPLIEVVRSDGPGEAGRKHEESSCVKPPLDDSKKMVIDEDDDDDDGPPPISFHNATSSARTDLSSKAVINDAPTAEIGRQQPAMSRSSAVSSNESTIGDGNNSNTDAPSLAEQLLAEAILAKKNQQRRQTQKEQRSVKKSTFGMKKGFLNSSSAKTSKRSGKKAINKQNDGRSGGSEANEISKTGSKENEKEKGTKVVDHDGEDEKNLVYELDNDGNMIPSSQSTQPSGKSDGNDPLHLPEVQSAMLSHLQSNSDQWATPDLLDSITQNHPTLARGMADPRYAAALRGMQTNPKETLEGLKKTSPEIVEWLMEFCGVMGDHFVKMGAEQQHGDEGGREAGRATTMSADAGDGKVREMGPLEKKALERHKMRQEREEDSSRQTKHEHRQKQQGKQPANATNSNEIDKQVSSILADDDLRSILLDPQIQRIMEECSAQGNKLRYYMGHEEYGPKLRRLMQAGLIRLG